jgi:glycosyltransferase involved in cell wall biosynthesis
VSPILLRFPVKDTISVLGPLTGNIYYPPAFRPIEPLRDKIRRVFHFGIQKLLAAVDGDKKMFQRVLISGGRRTRRSLHWAGCTEEAMVDVIDSGISDKFLDHAFIRHEGSNFRFMTSGRLVPHKGVELTIEALRHVTQPIHFDIYGGGNDRARLEKLAKRWGVEDKVSFLGWMESHDALIDQMAQYRGYMVPSLAEANGIVVQEAMMGCRSSASNGVDQRCWPIMIRPY